MSLSNPKLTNPCSKFIEFKGDTGTFQYYDKQQEKNIEVPLPLRFIYLDELNSVTGFSDQWKNGVYSNEVHNLNTQILNVKVFKSPVKITGKYKDIKAEIISLGGKFMKSIYIALLNEDGSLELANLKLKGSGFGGWLEKKFNPEHSPAIQVTETREDKKGAVKFHIPVFNNFEITADILKEAVSLDKTLQGYLKEYENAEPIEGGYSEPPIIDATNKDTIYKNTTQYPTKADIESDLPF
jgi:hypothetical protein